ncbi:hypothetical protein K461DRAFT_324790 [Myriangium duriaei CBS 260.36]|uniref:Uncharacterized protein n=1 Tax=Myriangium duriaei CBS 260.36 TaxID=1168546 RepID=A0A9P4MG04_9PEZI|nr:hypothetical protein K461DRAFT_324790 [Myriangium duriaei CBS 260.36]
MTTVLAREPAHVRRIVQVIAHIQAGTIPQHHRLNLRVFMDNVIKPTFALERGRVHAGAFSPIGLPEICTATMLRAILRTARYVMYQTFDCIGYFRQQYQGLQPLRLADLSFSFEHAVDGVPSHGALRQTPLSIPYPKQDVGQPTWLEEQRVIRAFWRIKLIEELEAAISDGTLTFVHIRATIPQLAETLRRICPLEFWYRGTGLVDSITVPYRHFLRDNRVELHVLSSVKFYLSLRRPPVRQRSWATPSPSGNDHAELTNDHSVVWQFFNDFVAVNELNGFLSFGPFEKCGFAIWTNRRLQGFGFLPGGPDPDMQTLTPNVYTHLWLSVLGPHGIQMVRQAAQPAVDQGRRMLATLMASSDPKWHQPNHSQRTVDQSAKQRCLVM